MTPQLTLGTRGSPLALAQANMVAGALRQAHGWDEGAIGIVVIRTTGDRVQDRPLAEIGGKALWTKELEAALHDRRIDLAVHSMKDVETLRPESLALAAMLPRADVRDRLLGAASLAAIAAGALVGTSSPRRAAQVMRARPDLRVAPIRGNVDTRLAKLAAGEVDATLLAAAGLDRLGRHDIGQVIETGTLLPAPAQGAVGIEIRAGDDAVRALLAAIDDPETSHSVMVERALLATLGGTCHTPVAALADAGSLRAEILSPDGRECHTGQRGAATAEAAHDLAEELLGRASPALRALFAG